MVVMQKVEREISNKVIMWGESMGYEGKTEIWRVIQPPAWVLSFCAVGYFFFQFYNFF